MNHFNDQEPDSTAAVMGAAWVVFIICLYLFTH